MSGWTKLFSSIVTSSIWVEPNATLRVWVALLATADADGLVEGSVPGFANLARVTVDEMRAAVASLSAPDPDSRTADFEGRRIEAIEGGWRILNYKSYRARGQAKDGSKAPAMRNYRARKRLEEGNALPSAVTSEPEARGEKQEARSEIYTHGVTDARAKDHAAHVFCPDEGACVTRFVHDQFVRALGKNVPDPDKRLQEFYRRVLKTNDGAVIGDATRFWRAQFEANTSYLTSTEFWSEAAA